MHVKKGKVYIGTSGWHYKHWAGIFYPDKLKLRQHFAYYQQHFATVEINNSFYRLPTAETFRRWREESPEDFVIVIKASRWITHQKKLKDPIETIKQFFENVSYLKPKLGVILFQLPPFWKVNVSRLAEFLRALPRTYRYTFEFRNDTWYSDEVFALLKKYKCALCLYELAGHTTPEIITTDFVYIRLHGPGDKYQGSYSVEQLTQRSEQCRNWQAKGLNVYLYFDNDQMGYAAQNAGLLRTMLS